jgi:two-component system, chemotaxis family, response regulator WspF
MRIAIVNDLALAREVLRRLVESVPGYSVAWTAADGAEGVRKASADRPDVILMDLIMPVMDGAEATRRIMESSPCPVLVVTASLGANFGKVYEALGAGGLDAVKTPVLGPDGRVRGGEALLERLARLARAGHGAGEVPARGAQPGTPTTRQAGLPLVAIGASTGGPEAVAQVLRALAPAPPAPVVVVQHIAADFAPGLATWLQGRAGVPVGLAREGSAPGPGQVYLAGRDDHLVLKTDRRFAYTAEPKANPYRPSVDVFFESLGSAWPAGGVAVVLTGMRDDGARGLAGLRKLGWHTIAQDRQTSVVYGMPKAAVERNAAVEVLPLPAIGPAALAHLRTVCG